MNFKNNYIHQIVNLLKKLALLLALYTFCRLLFYFFNASYFEETPYSQLYNVFLFGIRFDYSVIIQFNLLFIILFLLPFPFIKRKAFRQTLFAFFWAVNALLLLTNFIDIEYFKYTSKRTTFDIFKYAAISDDVYTLIPQFLRDFFYIPLLWILTVFAGIWFTREKNQTSAGINFSLLNLFLMLIVTGVLFITSRGFGMKPLRIISAARYTSSQNIPLLLNTPFTILHTIQETKNIKRDYFPEGSYQKIFSPLRQYKAFQKRNDNVVIIILESFSHEFSGRLSGKKTYTPFLDSLLNISLSFENGFANCRKSIEGIPAVLAGLPSLTNNSYISSQFASNRLEALPYILGKHGYTTSFFHGGRNGTMGFDEFSKVAGINNYYGMKEYKGPEAFDGNWGIFDDEFMQYAAFQINEFHEPFFSTIFTLSSHHPYKVPSRYDNLIPREEDPQLRSIRYSDIALRNFFNTARKQHWYKNTLFVLVADHTAKVIDPEYNNPVGTFRIPIAFYHPAIDSLRESRTDIVQQTDIMPSILHFLGIEDQFLSYGSSVFDIRRKPYAIDFLNGIYYYIENNYILSSDGETVISIYDFMQDKKLINNLLGKDKELAKLLEDNLKAIIQDYQTRLDENKMFNSRTIQK